MNRDAEYDSDFIMNSDFDLGIVYSSAGTLAADMGQIIEQSQRAAYRSVNVALVYRNWLLGRRIAEEELKGGSRAQYGKGLCLCLQTVEHAN